MTSIAYLANQFPSPVEPYVCDEIAALRSHGFTIIPCSARLPDKNLLDKRQKTLAAETLYLEPLQINLLIRAAWLCVREHKLLAGLARRVLLQGHEPLGRRARALLHTWLGAYYALLLEGRGVQHIHVHHGYFSCWVAMVAARLLHIGFSMTLHGSDLLLHRAYLEVKLKHCRFCLTISNFNRNYILRHYPDTSPEKLTVQHMGVDSAPQVVAGGGFDVPDERLTILAVGRLHRIKDHAFLVLACRQLKDRGLHFHCLIAGEGPERHSLERLINHLALENEVKLLGHLAPRQLDTHYAMSDLAVLTSRSEGIPLVLMEAMARGKVVLAPAITGIPELVIDGRTGFLYRPGSIESFVARAAEIALLHSALGPLRQAARQHVHEHFNRKKNLRTLVKLFRQQIPVTRQAFLSAESPKSHADPVLQ